MNLEIELMKLKSLEKKRDELRVILKESVEEAKVDIEGMKIALDEEYSNDKFDYMWGMMQWVNNMEKTLLCSK